MVSRRTVNVIRFRPLNQKLKVECTHTNEIEQLLPPAENHSDKHQTRERTSACYGAQNQLKSEQLHIPVGNHTVDSPSRYPSIRAIKFCRIYGIGVHSHLT